MIDRSNGTIRKVLDHRFSRRASESRKPDEVLWPNWCVVELRRFQEVLQKVVDGGGQSPGDVAQLLDMKPTLDKIVGVMSQDKKASVLPAFCINAWHIVNKTNDHVMVTNSQREISIKRLKASIAEVEARSAENESEQDIERTEEIRQNNITLKLNKLREQLAKLEGNDGA